MAIKILIADDHALVRQGIKRVLNFENGTYTSTNIFFTINLKCVSAIKCYNDINLAI